MISKEKQIKNIMVAVFITVLILVVTFYIGSVLYFNNLESSLYIEKTTLDENTNELISIYLGDSNGEYVYSSSSSFPTSGYEYNEEKSYCINESTLIWSGSQMTINTKGSDNCYVYFDEVPPLLYEQILIDNYEDENEEIVDVETAKTDIENKTTPSFGTAATTDEGMYAAVDDYGMSYYYRGAVDDNWVSFAGFIWQIVRIDGNGNVKLIYAGTDADSWTDDNISSSAFNSTYTAPKYIGYTYSNSEQFEVSEGDSNDSTAKGIIDTWYENNLEENYSTYLADVIWCNDRTTYSNNEYVLSYPSGTAVYYGAYTRLYTNKSPSYVCSNDNDKYTVSIENGNGLLDYPIALLTIDEIAYASGTTSSNTSFYLYNNTLYWTLSPDYSFSSGLAYVFILRSTGDISYRYASISSGLRVSVSLSSDVSISGGDGSAETPYEIA